MARRLLLVLALFVAACGGDDDPTVEPPDDSQTTTETPSDTGPAPSTASTVPVPEDGLALTGTAEVPGPGDEDGSGSAVVTLVTERSEVCYTIVVADIGAVTAAHIHRGAPDESGPVELGLTLPTAEGTIESCVAGNQILLEEMTLSPGLFYVNVHTDEFPDGALRGQLRIAS